MKATKIYRDNFVYSINIPLCDVHAKQSDQTKSMYAYIEVYDGDSECMHCELNKRQAAVQANNVHWKYILNGKLLFESRDRKTFWDFVRARRAEENYKIVEDYPNKCAVNV